MSVRQPRITEPAVISVYEDWRDLAERIGEDYFRTNDPSMLFAIFQGCQKDPKYKKGMWKIYQKAESKFKQKVVLNFMRHDLPLLINGNDLLEWKYSYALDAMVAWSEIAKKKDLVDRVNAKIAQSPRRKKLTRESIEIVFDNPRKARNSSIAARYLKCSRRTLERRAEELGIPLPWKPTKRSKKKLGISGR